MGLGGHSLPAEGPCFIWVGWGSPEVAFLLSDVVSGNSCSNRWNQVQGSFGAMTSINTPASLSVTLTLGRWGRRGCTEDKFEF